MPDRIRANITSLFLCAALFLPFVAQAQDDRLYRVELIVFSHSAGGAAEQWEATPDLAYPATSRFLNYSGDTPAPTSDGQPAAALPTAFVTLPVAQRELNGQAANMQRSGRYRILFHEAWMQPMEGESQSMPIVLDGSGDGGKWPALQGSVKLYMANHLYLQTNLWLNTQGEYLHSAWRMPAPPRGPASLRVAQSVPSPLTAQPESPASPMAPAAGLDSTPVQTSPMSAVAVDSAYPFRHAVLLKQTRRMRGGQVNYVDHPLLGVVVKITPVVAAEPGPATETDVAPEAAPAL